MSTPAFTQQTTTDKFVEGMRKLKTAALLHIIAWVLVVAATLAGYGSIFAVLGMSVSWEPEHGVPPDTTSELGATMGALIGMLVVTLAGTILALVATYGYLLPASSDFAEYSREKYGTVSTMLKVGYLGGIIAVLGGITIIVVGALARLLGFLIVGLIIAIVGLILFIIGLIGLAMLMFKLKDDTGDDTFLIAGILLIIGIFVNILDIIAWILVYVAAKPEARPISGAAHKGSDVLPPPPPA